MKRPHFGAGGSVPTVNGLKQGAFLVLAIWLIGPGSRIALADSLAQVNANPGFGCVGDDGQTGFAFTDSVVTGTAQSGVTCTEFGLTEVSAFASPTSLGGEITLDTTAATGVPASLESQYSTYVTFGGLGVADCPPDPGVNPCDVDHPTTYPAGSQLSAAMYFSMNGTVSGSMFAPPVVELSVEFDGGSIGDFSFNSGGSRVLQTESFTFTVGQNYYLSHPSI